jgi:ribosomal protein S18 acetylase RimI-like enzyme
MSFTMRLYQGEEDFWRIRAFLREIFVLNGRSERTWQAARLDYWRWHVVQNCGVCDPVERVTYLWEQPNGQIVAVLNPEGRGEAFFQIHPAFQTAALEATLLDAAEAHLAVEEDGKRNLTVWADRNDDVLRQEILKQHGYHRGPWPECRRQRCLDSIPDVSVPNGYTIRSLGGVEELPARSWASWRGFHPDEPDENYQGWEWYHAIQRMPLYRRDLDIVAAAPGGEIAAFCTLWYDDVTRTGYFEPVATVPEHQQRGLGKAVMVEAMRRMRAMGGTLVTVGGFNTAANALYASVMESESKPLERWEKAW